MDNEIICPACAEQYTDKNPPRLLVNCGHTFCEQCLCSMIEEHDEKFRVVCPEDNEEAIVQDNKMTYFPKNLALLRVIESKKNSLSFKDQLINMSKITKNSQPQEEEDSDLIGFINTTQNGSDKNKSFATSEKQTSQQGMCQVHHKPLDVVCINDLLKICASCAIFGAHKGHQFKSVDEIQTIKQKHIQSINEIIQQKSQIQEEIAGTKAVQQTLGSLADKKTKIRKKIVEAFNSVQDSLEKKKKQILKQLDCMTKKMEGKAKQLNRLDIKTEQKYKNWNKRSLKHLNILQQEDLQSKLILLFEGACLDGDIIGQGKQIIQQIEQNLYQNRQKLKTQYSLLNCSIKYDLIDNVKNFVQISNEQTPVKTKQIKKETEIPERIIKPQRLNEQKKETPKIQKTNFQERKQQFNFITVPENEEEDLLEVEQEEQKLPSQISVQAKSPEKSSQFNFFTPSEIGKYGQFTQNHQPMKYRASLPVGPRPLCDKNTSRESINESSSFVKGIDQSFANEKSSKNNKKKLGRLKIPQKYQKIIQGITHDTLDLIDLTNAELGDAAVAIISENLGTRGRTLKLIRNKLTDEGVAKILPYLTNIASINLSQNMLTENVLDILFENSSSLPQLKTVILSQNKIIERKHRAKIDKLKKIGWTVSV